MSAAVARAIRDVLVGANPAGVTISERAMQALDEQRSMHRWAASDTTTLVVDDRGRARWWTFAGWKANLWIAAAATDLRREVAAVDDLAIAVDPTTSVEDLKQVVAGATAHALELAPWILTEAVDGLKFSDCLPKDLAFAVVARRLEDAPSTEQALRERIAGWTDAHGSQ
jgi:ATP-dependent Lhr-like helicase